MVRGRCTLLPLLRESDKAAVVNVTSTTASLTLTAQGSRLPGDRTARAGYVMSKAALNMYSLQLAEALASDPATAHIAVRVVSPGWSRTRMNDFTADRTATEGAAVVANAVSGESPGADGFMTPDGIVPW